MATNPEPVVEVGDGFSVRWNRAVHLIPSHLSLTGEDGERLARVFADTEAEAWEKLPAVVDAIRADRAAAAANEQAMLVSTAAEVKASKEDAIAKILGRSTSKPASTALKTETEKGDA